MIIVLNLLVWVLPATGRPDRCLIIDVPCSHSYSPKKLSCIIRKALRVCDCATVS